nr:helix-turn-helix transcriptional regulator [Parabacteroides goldsteinii]
MNTEKLKDIFEKSKDKYADAKAIGTTYQSIYNIIYKGSICKVDLIERIAKFYNVPVGFFFDEEPKTDSLKSDSSALIESQQRTIENLSETIKILSTK